MSVVAVLLLPAGGWLFGLPTGDVSGGGAVSRELALLVEVVACRVSAPNGSSTSSSSAMLGVSGPASARRRISTGREAGPGCMCEEGRCEVASGGEKATTLRTADNESTVAKLSLGRARIRDKARRSAGTEILAGELRRWSDNRERT